MPRKQNEKPTKRGANSRSRDGFSGNEKKPFARPERRSRDDFKASDRPYNFNRDEKPERKSRKPEGDKPDFGKDEFAGKQRKTGGDDKPQRKSPFGRNRTAQGDDKKPVERKGRGGFDDFEGDKKPYERKPRSFDRSGDKPERKPRSFDGDNKKPYERKSRSGFGDDKKPYERKSRSSFGDDKKPYERKPRSFDGDDKKPYERKSRSSFGDDKKPYGRSEHGGDNKKRGYGGKKEGLGYERKGPGAFKKPFAKPGSKSFNAQKAYERKSALEQADKQKEDKIDDGKIRLNRYIANAGICSRREADVLIESGAVKVNGQVVTEMGFKVGPDDVVNYGGESLRREKPVYILLNKPKDYITTTDDPQERRTVMSLINHGGKERLYPVGRLDRNTTGLLLITNDGDMAKKLTHPSGKVKKVYHVQLDKNLKKADLEAIREGVELEDGYVKADVAEYVADAEDKKQVGIELHSGRNRVVRRIFEHLGYTVVKLDRVMFAGLTKKDLARGRSRYLTDLEINRLKMM